MDPLEVPLAELADALGVAAGDPAALRRAVAAGLPEATLGRLRERGFLAADEVRAMRGRTWWGLGARRSGPTLTVREGARALRLVRVTLMARVCFPEHAHAWLRRPVPFLGGRRPFDLTGSDRGEAAVRDVLARLLFGIPP